MTGRIFHIDTNIKSVTIIRFCITLAILTTLGNILLVLRSKFRTIPKPFVKIVYDDNNINETEHPNRLQNMHDFDYIIAQPSCMVNVNGTMQKPHFVVMIHSAPLKAKIRQGLRDSWFHSDPRMLSLFALGKTHSESLQKKIEKENEKYNDILQGNFIDAYHNLTYKHTMLFKWFNTHCSGVKFLVKMDDDVYMNVPAVFEYLEQIKNEHHSVIGIDLGLQYLIRSGKWNVTREEWRDDTYPPYAYGPSLIYTSKYVQDAYRRTLTARYYWVDDAYMTSLIRTELLEKITQISNRVNQERVDYWNGNSTTIPKPEFLFTSNGQNEETQRQWHEKLRALRSYQSTSIANISSAKIGTSLLPS